MRTTALSNLGSRGGTLSLALPLLFPLLLFLLPPLSLGLAACLPQKGTIGAVIAQDDTGRLFLRDVPAGLAAAQAHLQPGDEILLIDGLDVRFMDTKAIHQALVGEVDTPVKLTLIRAEQVLRVTLKRTEARRVLGKSARASASGH